MPNTVKRSTAIGLVVISVVITLIFSTVLHYAIGSFTTDLLDPVGETTDPKNDSEDEQTETYTRAEQLIEFIERNYYKDTADIDFSSGIYKGIFKSLGDPYSIYMDEEEFRSFNETSEGSYGGIGIQIEPGKDNLITIVTAFEDTPGERAGLKNGDKIIKVNGQEVYADGMDAAVKMMKGEPDTDVTITILRPDEDIFDVDITRAIIVLKAVKSHIIDKAGSDIGYIKINSFDNKVYSEFVKHYEDLKARGIQSLIIDLRNNPGGSLDQCVKIADYILGEQLIVYTEDRAGQRNDYKSDAEKIDIPYVVLVNDGSASASEILTGAIKDSNSGTIIGTTTFGKGLVQSVIPWAGDAGIKLTTAQYYTPNGTYIHEKGIEPNIVIEQSADYDPDDENSDVQLQKAIEILQ